MNARDAFRDARPYTVEEPTPLLRDVPSGSPYPLDALGPLRETAEALHDITQAPPAIGAQAVLGVAALAAQALGDAETLHGRAPASLFLLTVAQSGERKSACDRLAMRGVRAFEGQLAEARRTDLAIHRNRLEIREALRTVIVKGAKKDPIGAQADLDALGVEPEAPLFPAIVSAEPTVEAITRHMGALRPALGVFSDEGGSFIGGHGMSEDNRLRTVASLSNLWDGKTVSRWRAGEGVSFFPGRRLSVHLMAQPVAATQLLEDPIANGQGLLARFLLTEPASAIGTRVRVGHSPASDAALDGFTARVGDLLRRDLPLKSGTRNELEPLLVPLSDDARALLQVFALEVETAQGRGRDLEAVRPFASKAAEHAARIATVLTLYAGPEARTVTGETMADAVALATHYLGEAARLTDAAVISKETTEAERMRGWLLDGWKEPFISAGDAAQRGPFKETERARKALRVLQRHGWVVPVEGGAEVQGKRRREAWRVVRGTA